jgi:hypothetical protein
MGDARHCSHRLRLCPERVRGVPFTFGVIASANFRHGF